MAILCALLLACALDQPKLPFTEKYDAAFAEARARNVPVLIVDFDGWTPDRQQTQPSAYYEDKEFLAAAESAVLLLCSQEEHAPRREEIDGTARDVCGAWGGVPCNAHRDLLPKVFADFGRDGELVSPLFVIADADRHEVARLEHEQPPSVVTAALRAAAKKLGPGMPRSDYRALVGGLAKLRRLQELNEPAAAVALLETLKKIPGSFAPHAELKVAEQKLDEAGRGRLQRANDLWSAGRRLEALIEADDVRGSFGKLACVATAAAQVGGWEKDAAVSKADLAELKAHRAARQLYQQAVDQERLGETKRALGTVEKLLKQHPNSRFTDRARSLRDGLKG